MRGAKWEADDAVFPVALSGLLNRWQSLVDLKLVCEIGWSKFRSVSGAGYLFCWHRQLISLLPPQSSLFFGLGSTRSKSHCELDIAF